MEEECLDHDQQQEEEKRSNGQLTQRPEGIEEEGGPAETWPPPPTAKKTVRAPETPTETMEFLARSWSLSAAEISKALKVLSSKGAAVCDDDIPDAVPCAALGKEQRPPLDTSSMAGTSPPFSPRAGTTMDAHAQLLRAGGRAGGGGKTTMTMGAWMKEQKEKKRAEARSRNAQAYAATSVAGVAGAVAALVAAAVFSSSPSAPPNPAAERANKREDGGALASAAALVASHCVEMAQVIGASHEQIVASIGSAVNAQTSGDVMALTAGAATALRGAAMLRARLHREIQGATAAALPGGDGGRSASERDVSPLIFVSRGGELLKRTRQGILHWKLVTVYTDTNFQVIMKMKSAHMAGTFIKTKKCVVLDVRAEVAAWAGREPDDGMSLARRGYFGVTTKERVIEFECRSKREQRRWVQGITEMLNRREKTRTSPCNTVSANQ